MVDAAVRATIKVGLNAVVSLAADHVNLALEFPEELERLDKSAAMIRGFLAGADKDMRRPGVQNWLEQLEDEVFKADNVLDELNYENLLEEAFPTIAAGATTSRQTDSTIVRRDVLGRDEDESEIVKKLLTETESVISVIPITGMGGLGKTTLAKAVYNKSQIHKHFDKKIWVCVAEKVDRIEEVFKMILESLIGGKVEVDRREEIVKKIQDELKEKRYFLVLDDLWNDQDVLLDDFFSTLAGLNAKKGSWCLVTSRLQEVETILSRHPQINFTRHELGRLCDNDCWSIVKNWANVGEELPKELEDMREQVLRRCDGLPLAAKLIGGLLYNKKTKEEWLSILKESLLKGGIEQILMVSFDHLSPAPVKKCFAYCSIFYQDTELEQDRLVELWMAEGFLQPDSQNERMMEKIGCEYLRILLQTSLLEEVKYERRTSYKMHDLVHDFAKSILNRNSRNQDRYLAVYSSERETINEKSSASLRTLFLEGGIADDMLSKLKYLHVLKLFGADVKELPTSIGKLIHLHLLDISESSITTLPESLCKLYCLQTLRIRKLEEGFPKEMSNLISMRHLHYDHARTRREIQMPSGIGRWTCLQTLEFFNIGCQEEGRGIQELGTLQDLKGSLEIRNLELVNGKGDAELANLSKKPNLYRLVFEWGNRDRESNKCNENVLEGLQPHPNLKELYIRNFRGNQVPQWLVNSSSLVELHLVNCRELPTLGQLSSLQHLYLCGLENTTCIGLSFYTLKILTLESMKNLEEWKDAHEMDAFPVLEKLSISGCPKLTTIPTPSRFPSLDVLEITENCHVLLAEKSSLRIYGCNSLPLDMLERICLFPTLQRVELRHADNITTLRGMSCAACLERLTVYYCWNLRELPEDFYQFQALEHLQIEGCRRIDSFGYPNPKNSFGQKGLLKSLKQCFVHRCNALTRLPVEMFESCTSLRELSLYDCPSLVSFPLDLRRTPSLESFSIDGCDSLPTDMLERLCLFPTLQRVELRFADNITTLRGMSCAACLKRLVVFDCENLRELPEDLYQFQALEHLEIQYCRRIDSFGYPNPKNSFGQKGLLKSLEQFTVWGCDELTRLPVEMFESCTSLRELNLFDCRSLVSFPLDLRRTPSLESFSLWRCPNLIAEMPTIEFDWAGLASSSSLRHVSLHGMHDRKSLPHQLQDLTTITSLYLHDFGAIEALPDWLGNLTSLEDLVLFDCPKLEYLPSVDAMERLKLRRLKILCCPLLERRCTPQSGSEWPKISNIPQREIY
ncbi:unnamed protein product [Coffea canephora]|uniref:DH200=94 genomic scaffold, scaffold_1377 n=1 Tax=Coffea canephora TaxID=49390 RepID=A0A068VLL6_COFCA|nr:unnamed protein product [Coffea canephora]